MLLAFRSIQVDFATALARRSTDLPSSCTGSKEGDGILGTRTPGIPLERGWRPGCSAIATHVAEGPVGETVGSGLDRLARVVLRGFSDDIDDSGIHVAMSID